MLGSDRRDAHEFVTESRSSPGVGEPLLESPRRAATGTNQPPEVGTPTDGNHVVPESSVEVLLRLASGARFFRSADGRLLAQVPVGSRNEYLRVQIDGLPRLADRRLVGGLLRDSVPVDRSARADRARVTGTVRRRQALGLHGVRRRRLRGPRASFPTTNAT